MGLKERLLLIRSNLLSLPAFLVNLAAHMDLDLFAYFFISFT